MKITLGSWKENRTMLVLLLLAIPFIALAYFDVALTWFLIWAVANPFIGNAICNYLDRRYPTD